MRGVLDGDGDGIAVAMRSEIFDVMKEKIGCGKELKTKRRIKSSRPINVQTK